MTDKKYTADNIRALEGNEHVSMRPKLYFTECLRYRQSVAGGLPPYSLPLLAIS